MDNLYAMILSTATVLLAIEIITKLFPKKSAALVHGLAALFVVITLFSGILHIDFDFQTDFDLDALPSSPNTDTMYAEKGTALLAKRIYAVLNAAGIRVHGDDKGVEIWYDQDDEGTITIDRVRVCLAFQSDTDRAYAVLRGVLTDEIPTEVFVYDG